MRVLDLSGYCPLPVNLYRRLKHDDNDEVVFDWRCANRILIVGSLAKQIAKDNHLELWQCKLPIEYPTTYYRTTITNCLLLSRDTMRPQFQHLVRIVCSCRI